MEAHKGNVSDGLSYSTSMIDQNAVAASRKTAEDEARLRHGNTYDSSRNNVELRTHGSHMPHGAAAHRKDKGISQKESVTVSFHLIIG